MLYLAVKPKGEPLHTEREQASTAREIEKQHGTRKEKERDSTHSQ